MKTIAEIKSETGVPVVIANHRGIITEVNERFAAVFGWARDEIVGKRLDTIIPRRLRDTHTLGFSRFLRTGRPTILNQPLDLKALAKDGHEFAAKHLIVAERIDGNWMFAATIEPSDKP
jgi:PAS domain S-box-containing protein